MTLLHSKFINLYGSPFPPNAEAAILHGSPRYVSKLLPCKICATGEPIRYVKDDSCYGCAVRELKETLFNLRNDPSGLDHKVPTSPAEAIEYGVDYWFTGKACPRGPHPEKKAVDSSKCVTCSGENPRQAAISRGDKTYTPLVACKRCLTKAEKRVDNGKCSGCMPTTKKTHEPSAELMSGCPDIVLTRAEAKNMGFKVFRTGVACLRGHKGFRYVSTGGCLECKS
jgi:hypothetical protein